MAFCQKCGNQFADGTSFCPVCGAPVTAQQQAAPAQQAAPQYQQPAAPQYQAPQYQQPVQQYQPVVAFQNIYACKLYRRT